MRVLLLYFKSKGETKDISCETFARYGDEKEDGGRFGSAQRKARKASPKGLAKTRQLELKASEDEEREEKESLPAL